MATSILRLPEVMSRTGLSRSSVYLKIMEGSFPASISLGKRAVGWVESEIEDWISQQINASRESCLSGKNRLSKA